jgi:hypothetical protein
MEENNKKRSFGTILSILVMIEASFVVLVLTVVLIVKMFYPSLFKNIEKEYKSRFLTETTVDEVLNLEEEKINEI